MVMLHFNIQCMYCHEEKSVREIQYIEDFTDLALVEPLEVAQ